MELFQQFRHSRLLVFLKQPKVYWTLVVLAFALIATRLFWSARTAPLEIWDEQTNATVVRELVAKGDLFSGLTLNANPFLEKPPLWYYITARIVNLFGYSNFNLRVLSILSSIGSSIVIFFTLYHFRSRVCALTGLVLLSVFNQLYLINAADYFSSHTLWTADLDALQIFFLLLAQLLFLLAMQRRSSGLLFSNFIALALAYLTKGPLALIVIASEIIYCIIQRKEKIFKMRDLILGLGLFLVLIIPWHVIMYQNYQQDYLITYFGQNIINRSLVGIENHQEHWYFYFGLLLDPRINLLWPVLYYRVYSSIKTNWQNPLTKFTLIIASTYFIIINLMGTKLAWYLLYLLVISVLL